MSKEMLVIVLGVWVVILTQLGLPYRPWGAVLYALTGVAIAVAGFLLRGEALGRNTIEQRGPIQKDEHKEGLGPKIQ
ncbi:MAG: hypothetical protein V4474_02990 [Patescibacteria group bacterium]